MHRTGRSPGFGSSSASPCSSDLDRAGRISGSRTPPGPECAAQVLETNPARFATGSLNRRRRAAPDDENHPARMPRIGCHADSRSGELVPQPEANPPPCAHPSAFCVDASSSYTEPEILGGFATGLFTGGATRLHQISFACVAVAGSILGIRSLYSRSGVPLRSATLISRECPSGEHILT